MAKSKSKFGCAAVLVFCGMFAMCGICGGLLGLGDGDSDDDDERVVEKTKTQRVPAKENAPEKPKPVRVPLPEFEILKQSKSDTPGKAQLTIHVLVPKKADDESLRALLQSLYAKAAVEKGFKHHPAPTMVGIYVFVSKARYESDPGNWVAMLFRGPRSETPQITINERQLTANTQPPKKRFGLSESDRKEVWREIVRAEDRALRNANKALPPKLKNTAQGTKRIMVRLKNLTKMYRAEIAKKFKLTDMQLTEIEVEAAEKDWPTPAPR